MPGRLILFFFLVKGVDSAREVDRGIPLCKGPPVLHSRRAFNSSTYARTQSLQRSPRKTRYWKVMQRAPVDASVSLAYNYPQIVPTFCFWHHLA